MVGLCHPLPTLRRHPHERLRTARGQCRSLLFHCSGLPPHTPCQSPGALSYRHDPSYSIAGAARPMLLGKAAASADASPGRRLSGAKPALRERVLLHPFDPKPTVCGDFERQGIEQLLVKSHGGKEMHDAASTAIYMLELIMVRCEAKSNLRLYTKAFDTAHRSRRIEIGSGLRYMTDYVT